jgi:hypothetical protein
LRGVGKPSCCSIPVAAEFDDVKRTTFGEVIILSL